MSTRKVLEVKYRKYQWQKKDSARLPISQPSFRFQQALCDTYAEIDSIARQESDILFLLAVLEYYKVIEPLISLQTRICAYMVGQ